MVSEYKKDPGFKEENRNQEGSSFKRKELESSTVRSLEVTEVSSSGFNRRSVQ